MSRFKGPKAIKKGTAKKEGKKIFGLLVGLAGCALIIYLGIQVISYFRNKKISRIENNKGETTGTIIDKGSMKGSYAVIEYFVGGVRYELEESVPSDDIRKGEHYQVFYDRSKPDNAFISYDLPSFLSGEETAFTEGKVVSVISRNRVSFEYEVNGKMFKRFQKCPNDAVIQEQEVYTVEYLKKNPEIAILKITN